MTDDDPTHSVEAMSAETASSSEISVLSDDDLVAFWLKAVKEYDRLVWSAAEEFRRKGFQVARRVAWSQTELEHRRRKQPIISPTRSPDA